MRYMSQKDVLAKVMDTSAFLKIELNRVEYQKGYIKNIRGQGTFIGFDVNS